MARNVVRRESTQAKPEDGNPVDKAPLQGGTSGAPPDPNTASTKVFGLDDIAPAPATDDSQHPPVEPRRFRVIGGPAQVMYAGASVRIIQGKIMQDNQTDIDLLRRQGVIFEELKSEEPQQATT